MALANRIRSAIWAFRRNPNISIDQLDQMILSLDLGERSSSGVQVSEQTATRQATVYACINILKRDKSALPLQMFERLPSGGRAPVRFHPLNNWLSEPNPAMTPAHFRGVTWTHELAWGNSYTWTPRRPSQEVRGWPFSDPARMEVGVNRLGRKVYRYNETDGTKTEYRDSEVLHTYGFSFNGVLGVSPLRWNMETVGTAVAVGEYGAAYFRAPVPKVIATHPTGFKDDADAQAFREKWNSSFAGKRGLSTIAVLPKGMEVAQVVKIPNDEAQFIETKKFSKEEIAQIYNVPMHRLQALDRATFSNIEHQDIEYVKYTLLPALKSREESLEQHFLTPEERERFFVRHNVEGLLRGDFKTRQEGHAIGINAGFKTRNEARAHENLEPIEGLDEPLVPMNMGPASKLDQFVKPSRERTEG